MSVSAESTVRPYGSTHDALSSELSTGQSALVSFLNATPDIAYLKSRDGRYLLANAACARIFARETSEIVGQDDFALFPAEHARLMAEEDQSVFTSGEPLTVEHWLPSGQQAVFLQTTKSVVRDAGGAIAGLVGIARDLTGRERLKQDMLERERDFIEANRVALQEQRLAEAESRTARVRLQNVLDSITDGLCVLDRDLTYVYFNEPGARMVGLRPADIVGTRVGDTFKENKTNLIARSYRHSLETGQPVHVEEFSFAPLNKWFESNAYPSADGLTVYFRDISERKRTEQALRDSESRFRLLAESLPEFVWTTDPLGSLTYLNSRFLRYCGIPVESMVGFDWQTILHPDDLDRVNQAWQHSVNTGEPYLVELRLRGHDGAFRHFLARAIAMVNPAGEIERWVGSCTDVHDQKLAEEALRRSEKLAATGRLAASIAHEINNPLESVTNALYLALQDPALSVETRSYLTLADQELARVSQITTHTLRFHRQSKSAKLADLGELMRSVLPLFRQRFAAREIQFVSNFAPSLQILCFEDEIRQVFTNLIGNCLDATPIGGNVTVRVRNSTSNGVRGVRVTVADTGCGIPLAIQQRIFEPFFSTKDATGIGLGLWVSEGILRKHSVRITLRSSTATSRHGTVFSLFFPETGVPTAVDRAT